MGRFFPSGALRVSACPRIRSKLLLPLQFGVRLRSHQLDGTAPLRRRLYAQWLCVGEYFRLDQSIRRHLQQATSTNLRAAPAGTTATARGAVSGPSCGRPCPDARDLWEIADSCRTDDKNVVDWLGLRTRSAPADLRICGGSLLKCATLAIPSSSSRA